jgi:hypothetical protein
VAPVAGDQDLADRIERRGNVPVALELTTLGDIAGPIDAALTHGASMSLVR